MVRIYSIIKIILMTMTLYKENQIGVDQKNSYGVTPFFLANLRKDK